MRRLAFYLVSAMILAATLVFWFARQKSTPPGFYTDESSIAYNALTIARSGVDEHDVAFPLYFKAFGEYKNPVYIYLLAGLFEIAKPSNLVARRFSAFLGYLAALALGLLAWLMTRTRVVAWTIFLMTIATPMLFEISRLVFEVALYPLILALLLAAAWLASQRPRWSASLVGGLTATLVLLAYTYSIGRLFAGLLALGLLLFYTRERRTQIAAVWIGFALLAVIPIAIYNQRHDHALTLRASQISYIPSLKGHPLQLLAAFEQHLAGNALPIGLSVNGDPNPRHHVPGGGGSILFGTFALAIIGVAVSRRDRWLAFLLYGTALSLIPASLMNDELHSLRLVPLPIFLIALCVPALTALWTDRRRLITTGGVIALLLCVVQFGIFATNYFRHGGEERAPFFEGGIRRVVDDAIAQPLRPIVVEGNILAVHAYWYASQRGVGRDQFLELADGSVPPAHALVIARDPHCEGCSVVSRHGEFAAIITP